MWQRNSWRRSIDFTIRCAGTVAQEIQEQLCDAESAEDTTYVGRNVNWAPNNCRNRWALGPSPALMSFYSSMYSYSHWGYCNISPHLPQNDAVGGLVVKHRLHSTDDIGPPHSLQYTFSSEFTEQHHGHITP
jgi:hypothetical protein